MAEVARLYVEAMAIEAESEPVSAEEALTGEAMRIAEAMLFAAAEPLEEGEIARRMPEGIAVGEVLARLKQDYASRGVNLVRVGKKWLFRTAADLGWLLSVDSVEPKKLSKAALETLAIIAYHQPVTRAEIEDIRGVAISKGTLDVLLETGWVRLRGRRRTPGRPLTYGTSEAFLLHFGLEVIGDLPGLEELKGAGLFEGALPQGFAVPLPRDDAALMEDEDPLESDAREEFPDLSEEVQADADAETETAEDGEEVLLVEEEFIVAASIEDEPLEDETDREEED
ncbi:condensin subunit ScpB [Methylovirgula ligni]|uniref:Condensin subunit ScpB n=2 Tax=Methylovirgula ligni TaxID=569860 RepID=A0A3D9YTP4_9HYPH|nr:condensin subunit ScpB [Methylovirgula ligni]